MLFRSPAGNTWVAKVKSVLAAKLNVSAIALVLFTNKVKRATTAGLVATVVTGLASGPAPAPGAPGSALVLVKSTVFAVTAVSVSVAVAVLVGSVLEVAVLIR